jgi:formylglycine-generating enzyme required for sulfatase activity
MRIKIDIEIPQWTRWLVGGAAIGIVLCAGAVVLANAVALPNIFGAGEKLSAAKMNENFNKLRDAINETDPDCPRGYLHDLSVMNLVVCKKGSDEVVKVRKGGSAFWIDRYEASVWSNPNGTGTQFGINGDDVPAFSRNGQGLAANQLFAVSRSGVAPSQFITWFQANRACGANGKRLPTHDEWLEAASATSDPGVSSGAGGTCVTTGTIRITGLGTSCTSTWGAQDMLGNLWEWTSEWYAGLGNPTAKGQWPASDYGADLTTNIDSAASDTSGNWPGIPAAAARGGCATDGLGAGVFALNLDFSPSTWSAYIGFRCVVPR